MENMQLLDYFSDYYNNKELVKLVISKAKFKSVAYSSISIKPILLKEQSLLQFNYKYERKEIVKNHTITESLDLITEALETSFFNADLFSIQNHHIYLSNKKGTKTLKTKTNHTTKKESTEHDHKKARPIETKDNVYLQELGILDANFKILPTRQFKYKQINRYIELLSPLLSTIKEDFSVVDMGSGKGYLTFALYDYLSKNFKQKSQVTGIEIRPDMVNFCNDIANKADFENLNFVEGSIVDTITVKFNILVALHACDTATDEALYAGIKNNAKVIVVSPCCHKQIRKAMNSNDTLAPISNYGIFKERQAEIITDTLRALILEANGYKTKVMEFIESVHTPKNLLITAEKRKENFDPEPYLKQINDLKAAFGIKEHYLEKLLKQN